MAKKELSNEKKMFCKVFRALVKNFFGQYETAVFSGYSLSQIKKFCSKNPSEFPTQSFATGYFPVFISELKTKGTTHTVETIKAIINPIIQPFNLLISNSNGIASNDLASYVRLLLRTTYDFATDPTNKSYLATSDNQSPRDLLFESSTDELIKKRYKKSTIKAVVFDFDGTLTRGKITKSTWEAMWTALGYSVNECRLLHDKFDKKEIDHTMWCKLTEEKFIAKRLNKKHLTDIISQIKLIKNIDYVFQVLDSLDIKIYIVSGSITHIIKRVLKNLYHYIDGMKANRFDFDEDGYLTAISGTKYDFEGKAKYIEHIAIKKLEIPPNEILFVGNSRNDIFAHTSGAKTLCINPSLTNPSNKTIWHNCIQETDDLKDILPFIVDIEETK